MNKLDLRKKHKHLYKASPKEAAFVDVPALNFVMIDGQGAPDGSQEFQDAIGALYGAAYTLKFMLKKSAKPRDFTVMALEGLWWCEGANEFRMERKGDWRWTLMIQLPDFITRRDFTKAVEQLKEKKASGALAKIRLEKFKEGRCAQILHVGPYSSEPPTIAKMHEFMRREGRQPAGKHHEIYLSDPRRTAPEKIKTILRQAVA